MTNAKSDPIFSMVSRVEKLPLEFNACNRFSLQCCARDETWKGPLARSPTLSDIAAAPSVSVSGNHVILRAAEEGRREAAPSLSL